MSLNLDAVADFKKGKWVDYDEDVSFLIRPLTQKIAKKLKTEYTNVKTAKGGKESIEITNDALYNSAVIDNIIGDWKGVVDNNNVPIKLLDDDGKPLANAKELKVKLTDNFTALGLWILRRANEIAEEIATVDRDIEEN